jgi:hypothetical protein
MTLTAFCAFYELSKVESHIQTIGKAHAAPAGGSDMHELFRIVQQPGQTAPAELAFLLALLESIKVQAPQVAAMQQSRVAAAQLVSTARSAGAQAKRDWDPARCLSKTCQ